MDLFGKMKLNSYLCRAKKERDGKKHYGKPPIIYCSQPFYTKNFLGQFNDCQYWCGDVNAPVVLPHAIHQKTIKMVAGIKGKVDYNILNCKLKEIQL